MSESVGGTLGAVRTCKRGKHLRIREKAVYVDLGLVVAAVAVFFLALYWVLSRASLTLTP